MKIAFRKYRTSWFFFFCAAAVLAILACNAWLLCCGRCAFQDFLRVPPIGWAIIMANLVAVLILLFLKRRNRRRTAGNLCRCCQIVLRDDWSFCANCGTALRG